MERAYMLTPRTPMAPLNEQVDEVQLIQACTSEGEFQWRGSEADARAWQALVAGESNGNTEGAPSLAFSLRLSQETPLWLNVDYPRQSCDQVQMVLQGPQVARHDLDRIKRVVQQRHSAAAREGFEHVVFDVFTAVQAYLTEEPISVGQPCEMPEVKNTVAKEVNRQVKMARVIFWTHHLKAPTKKRDMTAWCTELSIWGLVKSGYPGYLCFEGQQDDIQEIVRRIKAMQWHAITVKTEEPYLFEAPACCTTLGEVRQEALQHCLLAIGHSGGTSEGGKLRPTMDEVDTGKDLVDRLKIAAIPEDEYTFALNLRTKGSAR